MRVCGEAVLFQFSRNPQLITTGDNSEYMYFLQTI